MNVPSFDIAASMDELAPWREQWDALADAGGLPMTRYAWFSAAERHLAGSDRVCIVYVRDPSGDLVAAAALESRRDARGRDEYHILGLPRLYEPSALLYRDASARKTLLKSICRLGNPVFLGRLWPDDTESADRRRLRLDRHAVWLHRNSSPSQYLQFTHDYAGFIERLPAQRRYDLRRAYKRAEAAGPIGVDIRRPAPAELDALLDTALAIEARSWKGDTGSAVLKQQDLQRFFRDMLANYARDGCVLIALLKSGPTAIAMQICLLAHARLWLLKIGYDQAYGRISPGHILMNEVIRYSYNHRLRGLELLGSAEDWVDAWRPSLRDYRLVAAFPHNAGSLMRLAQEAAARLPGSLRQSTTMQG